MGKTTVANVKRDEFDVYIGRRVNMGKTFYPASKWGNPFRIGQGVTREQVIEKYRAFILTRPDLMASLPELRGKRLGCWCAPLPCHGDVLAELSEKIG